MQAGGGAGEGAVVVEERGRSAVSERDGHRGDRRGHPVELQVRAKRGEVGGAGLEGDDARARNGDRREQRVRPDVRPYVVEHLARLQVLLDPSDRPGLLPAGVEPLELGPGGELQMDGRARVVEPSVGHGGSADALVIGHSAQMGHQVAQATRDAHCQIRRWSRRSAFDVGRA